MAALELVIVACVVLVAVLHAARALVPPTWRRSTTLRLETLGRNTRLAPLTNALARAVARPGGDCTACGGRTRCPALATPPARNAHTPVRLIATSADTPRG